MASAKANSKLDSRLEAALKLRGQSGVKAFDRIKILNEVFDDRRWRDEQGLVDDFQVAEVLDEYVEDLCHPFLTLRAMSEFFPDRQKWSEGKLATMFAEMRESQQAEKEARPKREVRRATVSELEKAIDEKKHFERVAERLQQEREEGKTVLQRLMEENQKLKIENAELRGRVKELERILSRETIAA